MDSEHLEHLKKKHGFDEWKRDTEGQAVIGMISLEGLAIPGFEADHVDFVEARGFPPAIHSMWRAEEPGRDRSVSLQLYRCQSPREAEEFLLRLLEEFQSAQVERLRGPEALADVAFGPPGGHAVLFALANVVVLLRNAGRDLVPVGQAAQAVVGHLRGQKSGRE